MSFIFVLQKEYNMSNAYNKKNEVKKSNSKKSVPRAASKKDIPLKEVYEAYKIARKYNLDLSYLK